MTVKIKPYLVSAAVDLFLDLRTKKVVTKAMAITSVSQIAIDRTILCGVSNSIGYQVVSDKKLKDIKNSFYSLAALKTAPP